MALARIRKGDQVVVLNGREKGKRGTVREVLPDENRAFVQELNIVKRRFKQGTARQAGIVDREMPIHLSNLAPIDPKTNKPTRVSTGTLTNGKKIRVATSGEQLDKE